MGNLVLNKPATASSYVKPYAASKAVNGSAAPVQRWLSNTVPAWVSVNLQGQYWINRWVLKHMGSARWATPQYVLSDFKLQGSLDNANWFDIDVLTGNTAATTDRTFNAVKVAYVRVYVTKGLNINPRMASIMELEVYEAPPTSPYLSNLTVNPGTINPAFTKTGLNYTSSVSNDITQVAITPTAEDPGATIKVNNVVVPSGQAYNLTNLVVGNNPVTIQVTSKIGALVTNYTLGITRQSSPYLSNLTLSTGALEPAFSRTGTTYTGYVANGITQVAITPTPEDSAATIKVNGVVVTNGQPYTISNLGAGNNPIAIEVTSSVGGVMTTYNLNVIQATSPYLSLLNIKTSTSKDVILIPPFNTATTQYTASVANGVSSVTVIPTAVDINATIKVKGVVVPSGQTSGSISLIVGSNSIDIEVISAVGRDSRTYYVAITRNT